MTAEQLSDYLSSVRSVTVDDQTYSAFGRGAVQIIDPETGSIDTSNTDIFNNDTESFTLTVSAEGYEELTFTIKRTAEPDDNNNEPDNQNNEPDDQNNEPDDHNNEPVNQNNEPDDQNNEPDDHNNEPDNQNNEPDDQNGKSDDNTAAADKQNTSPNAHNSDNESPTRNSNNNIPSTSDNSTAGVMLTVAVISVLSALILVKKKKMENR